MFFSDVLADVGDGVVDGVVGEVLGEVGEDHEVRDAFEGGEEVGGEFLVEFGGTCLQQYHNVVGSGNVAA